MSCYIRIGRIGCPVIIRTGRIVCPDILGQGGLGVLLY